MLWSSQSFFIFPWLFFDIFIILLFLFILNKYGLEKYLMPLELILILWFIKILASFIGQFIVINLFVSLFSLVSMMIFDL